MQKYGIHFKKGNSFIEVNNIWQKKYILGKIKLNKIYFGEISIELKKKWQIKAINVQ